MLYNYYEYATNEVDLFIEQIKQLDVLIGFNNKRFDNRVLSAYTDFDFRSIHTIDILEDIFNVLGFRLSLDHLANITLGAKKSADGLQAIKWWREGRLSEIIDYCSILI